MLPKKKKREGRKKKKRQQHLGKETNVTTFINWLKYQVLSPKLVVIHKNSEYPE